MKAFIKKDETWSEVIDDPPILGFEEKVKFIEKEGKVSLKDMIINNVFVKVHESINLATIDTKQNNEQRSLQKAS